MFGLLHSGQKDTERELIGIRERLTRSEAFIEIFGEKLMKVMHRSDDAYGADWLFDEYRRRDGELTPEQWDILRKIYMKVIEEGEQQHTRGELIGAAGIVAFCEHKLRAFRGFIWEDKPPTQL